MFGVHEVRAHPWFELEMLRFRLEDMKQEEPDPMIELAPEPVTDECTYRILRERYGMTHEQAKAAVEDREATAAFGADLAAP
jgi:hypothetical protein